MFAFDFDSVRMRSHFLFPSFYIKDDSCVRCGFQLNRISNEKNICLASNLSDFNRTIFEHTKCRILLWFSPFERISWAKLWITWGFFLHWKLKYKCYDQYGVWCFIKHRSMVDSVEKHNFISNILLLKWTNNVINYHGFYKNHIWPSIFCAFMSSYQFCRQLKILLNYR